MIAYSRTSLDNRTIREQTDQALTAGCITKEEHEKIGASHPVDLYTPNIYVCIGLFLLTVVIVIFSMGLIYLISTVGNSTEAPFLIFSGLVCYGVLEYFVQKQRHFSSGVDYALIWTSAFFIYGAVLSIVHSGSAIPLFTLLFAVALFYTLRFANNIMALLAYAALLGIIFNIAAELGTIARQILPFIIMAVSVAAWFLGSALHSNEKCRHYHTSLTVLRAASLVSFYLAGNYFVVRELSGYLSDSPPLSEATAIPLGWLFWTLSIATPLVYIGWGIRKKSTLFLWTGLALIAAAVFTIRQYYSVLPIELAMLAGGILILAIVWGLIRYLKIPRHGFTSEETSDRHFAESLPVESLVIAETFGGKSATPPSDGFRFGGGSGGGGGAGGQY